MTTVSARPDKLEAYRSELAVVDQSLRAATDCCGSLRCTALAVESWLEVRSERPRKAATEVGRGLPLQPERHFHLSGPSGLDAWGLKLNGEDFLDFQGGQNQRSGWLRRHFWKCAGQKR